MRGRVGVVVGVGVGGEPVDVCGRLRDFVGDLAVVALVAGQEGKLLGDQLPLSQRVHGMGVDHRVAAEEPAEAGTRTGLRQSPPRHESAPQVGVADALLLQVDLGPFERQVERRVGGLDRGGGGQRRVGPGAGVPVEQFGVRDQTCVAGEDRIAGYGSASHRDRDELPPGALRADRDDHGAGRLAELVRGVRDRVRRPRRTHHRVARPQALGEDEDAPSPVPVGVLSAQRRRPHVVEDRLELGHDLQ